MVSFNGMHFLAITPGEFQAAALGWIGVITVILGAVAAAVIPLVSKIAAAREALKQLGDRVEDHSRRITANNEKLTSVALQVKPEVTLTQNNQEK